MKKRAGCILTEHDWRRLSSVVEEIVEKKIEETRPKWVDSMLSAGDKAAGYFKKFDEEKTILAGQVEDLDERVQKIEEKFGFPQVP